MHNTCVLYLVQSLLLVKAKASVSHPPPLPPSPPPPPPDPNVSRYRVQWFSEFCSHNGTRVQEKLITQVASQFVLPYMNSQVREGEGMGCKLTEIQLQDKLL